MSSAAVVHLSASEEFRLIRLHPAEGGAAVRHAGHRFVGVSPDIFVSLDKFDRSDTYLRTLKFNLGMSINPALWPTKDFLCYFTEGPLEKTDKCQFHGDKETGLTASANLLNFVRLKSFTVAGKRYSYDSIGIAMNDKYQQVSHRRGNEYSNISSHFELKFLSTATDKRPPELLCLNIHITAVDGPRFNQDKALDRLKASVDLFYSELGLSESYELKTDLRKAFEVNLGNCEAKGFLIKHGDSVTAYEDYGLARLHTRRKAEVAPIRLSDLLHGKLLLSKPARPFSTATAFASSAKLYKDVAQSAPKTSFSATKESFPTLAAAMAMKPVSRRKKKEAVQNCFSAPLE